MDTEVKKMPVDAGPSRNYLPSLTSLRFLAAASVVVYHTHNYFGYGTWLSDKVALDQGVSFFFVLSGFILFYNHSKLRSRLEGARFVAARIARIWPLHIATLFITVAFVASPWGPAGPAIGPAMANVLLLQSWIPIPGYFFSLNAVSWSLSAELFFYVCFPILVWKWSTTWTLKILFCVILTAGTIYFADMRQLQFYDGSETVSIDAIVYINPMARLLEFVLGMVAAHGLIAKRDCLILLPSLTVSALEVAALALVILSMTLLPNLYGALHAQSVISSSLLRWLISSGTAPFFAFMISVLAIEGGVLSRALGWAPFVLLGNISFSLYMCHQILFRSLTSSGTLSGFGSLSAQMAVFWVFALIMSYALFQLVEHPCRKLLFGALTVGGRRFVSRPHAAAGVEHLAVTLRRRR